MDRLNYRTALITGASSGLGRGLSAWFAERGVKVYGAARRVKEIEQLARDAKGEIVPVEMDVADTNRAIDRIARIDQECGGLDLVIANAGVGHETNPFKLDWAKTEQIISVNVMGAAATLTAVLPRMIERGRGHLVGISSLAAFRGLPRHAGYSASKAFLSTFLEGLRVDLQTTPIKVTIIHPGFVRTPINQKNWDRLPFLVELDEAVERMGEAIVRAEREYSFPWQVSTAVRVARWMPDGLWDAVGRRVSVKPKTQADA